MMPTTIAEELERSVSRRSGCGAGTGDWVVVVGVLLATVDDGGGGGVMKLAAAVDVTVSLTLKRNIAGGVGVVGWGWLPKEPSQCAPQWGLAFLA